MTDLKLSLEDRARFRTELARVFGSQARLRALLADIGFPWERMPASGGRAEDDWRFILESLDDGVLPDGYRSLLGLVLQAYPYNSTFRELAAGYAPGLADRPTRGDAERDCHVMVGRDDDDVAVRALADAGLAPQLMWSTPLVANYRVGTGDPARVEAALRPTDARWTTIAPGAPEYLLSHLTVQGPDGRSFRFSDVPAATTVADLAADALAEYPDSGARRPVTAIDVVSDDGTARRLPPDETLDDAGVRDGDSLRVGFQATAGAVNPLLRQEALYRARKQILAFAAAHPDIAVSADDMSVPTVYELEFTQRSLGPPPGPGEEPADIDHHVVLIELGADYPLTAPTVYWLTAVFHPNVYPTYDCELARRRPELRGLVCLGELAEAYQPGLDLGQLCQILRDLAAFRNYSLVVPDEDSPGTQWRGNAFDAAAAAWVMTHPERIVALGGRAWPDRGASRVASRGFTGHLDSLSP